MSTERFAYVWQYTVKPERLAEYLAAYRPDGAWAELFARDAGYLRTELFRDVDGADRYVTVDYWTSRAARDAFRERFAEEFSALDSACEDYTLEETFVGDYAIVE